MKSLQLSALKSAERFVLAELAVREKSYLPDPTEAEQRDISEALEVKQIIQRAIVSGEIEPDLRGEMLEMLKKSLIVLKSHIGYPEQAWSSLCFEIEELVGRVER